MERHESAVSARIAGQAGRKALEHCVAVLAGGADLHGVDLNASAAPRVR